MLIQRADLFQQHDAVLGKAGVRRPDVDVGGQTGFVQPGCNGRRDHGGAVPVADLILHDQHRAHAALLGADHRRQVGVEYFSSVYFHGISLPVCCGGWPPPVHFQYEQGRGGLCSGAYSIVCTKCGQVSGAVSRMQKASAMPPSWLSERWAVRPWSATQRAVAPENR